MNLVIGRRQQRGPLSDRLERFIVRLPDAPGCWLWTGATAAGYGTISVGPARARAMWGAHRLSYAVYRGPIPDGLHVCHRCDVKLCVRPDHLFLGTPQDNVADMCAKGRYVLGNHRGERNGRAKLTRAQVESIRRRAAAGESRYLLGQEFCVRRDTISEIIFGRRWREKETS